MNVWKGGVIPTAFAVLKMPNGVRKTVRLAEVDSKSPRRGGADPPLKRIITPGRNQKSTEASVRVNQNRERERVAFLIESGSIHAGTAHGG